MKTMELKIEGMSCGHCVMSVRRALSKLPGVEVMDVRIGGATVALDPSKAGEAGLAEAVGGAGYVLVSAAEGTAWNPAR